METYTRRRDLSGSLVDNTWLLPDSLWTCHLQSISPLYVERFKGARAVLPLTVHDFWEFTAVMSGNGVLETETESFRLHPGLTLLTAPGVRHREIASEGLDTIWIGFELSGISEALDPVIAVSDAKMQERIVRYWQFAFLRRPGSGLELDGRLLALLGYFLRVRTQQGGEEADPIHCIIEYLHEHFAETLDIPALAEELHWSESYFHRRFKAGTGYTPARYLSELRLKQAAGFLTHSDLPLSQIARLCGFTDPYYLSKVFHKRFGVCPSSFRSSRHEERNATL